VRRHSDLLRRLDRMERERGLSPEQLAVTERMHRFDAKLTAFESDRDRIAGMLPPGWRLVKDHFVGADGRLAVDKDGRWGHRYRATPRDSGFENGCLFDLEGRIVGIYAVTNGCGHVRQPQEGDEETLAGDYATLPEDLRKAIKGIESVDWMDYFNEMAARRRLPATI
jgi:hypothetical protein